MHVVYGPSVSIMSSWPIEEHWKSSLLRFPSETPNHHVESCDSGSVLSLDGRTKRRPSRYFTLGAPLKGLD